MKEIIIKEKIKELAKKYNIPEALLEDALQMEQKNLVYTDNRRRLMSELEKIIVEYSD